MPIANRVMARRLAHPPLHAMLVLVGSLLVASVAIDRAVRAEAPTAAPALVATPSVTRQAPRSHLQPVGEMVGTRPSAGIGLRLVRAPDVLRDQLALERGSGLVVEAVHPGSAAAHAGFMVNDVVVRIDDQLMLLPEQFVAFVEASPRDTPLACHVLRAGKQVMIDLRTRGDTVLTGAARMPSREALRPSSSTLAKLPRRPPTGTGRDAPAPPTVGPSPAEPVAIAAAPTPPETLVRKDADYQIRLTAGDETRLLVTDRLGRLVFDDCIDTPEARSRLPRAVRERVERMERHLELRPAATDRPVADVGRLDVPPITIR